MTKSAILDLQNGQVVHVKLWRLERVAPRLDYEGTAILYVQRHRGEVVTIAISEPMDWAEYDPRRDFANDSLVTEDYEMEIFE